MLLNPTDDPDFYWFMSELEREERQKQSVIRRTMEPEEADEEEEI